MYGAGKTKAFCSNCKDITLHEYTSFSTGKSPQYKSPALWRQLLGFRPAPIGDYKCLICGTYLRTPDNLDNH